MVASTRSSFWWHASIANAVTRLRRSKIAVAVLASFASALTAAFSSCKLRVDMTMPIIQAHSQGDNLTTLVDTEGSSWLTVAVQISITHSLVARVWCAR